LDNDGDEDIYTVMGGAYSGDVYPNLLFINPGHGRHWINLKLEGVEANRSAIGARVMVELEGGRRIHRVVSSGGSFGANSLDLEIGLGAARTITVLEVIWPGSGTRQRFAGIEPDRFYRVREGDTPVELARSAIRFAEPSRPAALRRSSAVTSRWFASRDSRSAR
ncbi:MAG: ASPIC/UnbV domain-containing protein, partial [Verrucomicrobiota bacterium]